MASDSLYVIGPTAVFQEKYDDYVAKGFVNRGGIRYSNDETKVLVEEAPEMFEAEDLAQAEFTGNEEEIRLYLQEHSDEWESEEII